VSGLPYDLGSDSPGVFERHADWCGSAEGEPCTCGPLGYIATMPDAITNERAASPMLETLAEARAWRREQEVTARAATNGHAREKTPARRAGRATEGAVARTARHDRPRRTMSARVPREPYEPPEPRRVRPPAPDPEPLETYGDVAVSALIDMFLDAAEDGEARGRDGRPYSDDEIADLSWALTGYVESHFGDLGASTVRGRHVFRLIDELEDAGMPRSRLRSVIDALRALFDYATDRDLVRVNPATYISLPADERPRARLPETLELGAPGRSARGVLTDGVVSERVIWMCVKIVTLAFVCIALILVAESV
jgi:hypothetical protein